MACRRPDEAGPTTSRRRIPLSVLARARVLLGGVLAVDPRAGELLILRRHHHAALVAALPADHVVRLAVVLAALLPVLRPAGVGLRRLALILVPEQHLALAIALDAHCHRRERRGAQLRRAQQLVAVAVADTLQEVLPQRVGRVA